MFKKSIIIFCIILSVIIVSCSQQQASFRDNFGSKVNFSNLKGNWIIINYWANWCESCIKEIPELNKFYKNNKNKKVRIFGVNYDGLTGKKLEKSIRRFKIKYPVLLNDPDKVFDFGNIEVIPTTFIINPEGKVVKKLLGPQTAKTLETITSN